MSAKSQAADDDAYFDPLGAAFLELSPLQRTIVTKAFGEKIKREDLAKELRMSPKKLDRKTTAAMMRFKAALEKHGIFDLEAYTKAALRDGAKGAESAQR